MKKNIIIKIIISFFMFILSVICFNSVLKMNIIPNKYLLLFGIVLFVLNLCGDLLLFFKGKIKKIFSILFYVLLLVICFIGIKYSKYTVDFFNKGFNNSKDITVYDVIVLKDSNYNSIEELDNKVMGYLSFDIENQKYLDDIKEKVNINLEQFDIKSLYENLLNKNIDSIIINDGLLYLFEDIYKDFSEETKILYSFDVEKIVEETKYDEEKLKSFNIYLSGSDSRSQYIVANSLSDVNMIITVNPNTNKILLTSIPRDYYVQLHGTTGLKDKLTHAGIYGVDMSRTTLEDVFGIKIDYSVKVGMPSVVKLVDLIGGIEVYSDTAFYSYHYKGWYVNLGMNYMDGTKALAYARERYAYEDGDKHRVRNQQQVLEAVFKKIVSDKSLLLRYEELLNSFSSLYVTDIPKELITEFMKYELDKMPNWTIEKQFVDGYGMYTETYSMPGWTALYVLVPDENSLNAAINKINEVFND